MNRGQMRLEVLRALNAEDDTFFDTTSINDWLNEGIKTMCSVAQPLQAVATFTTVAGKQEYFEDVPKDIDQIFGMYIYQNNSFKLEQTDIRWIADGMGNRQGRPTKFYTRRYSQQTGSINSAGNITPANIPNGPAFVVGLDPKPASAMQVTMYYYPRHYNLTDDLDVPIAIPDEYHRGVIAYAVALGKEKEAAYGEAERWRGIFREYADRLRIKSISRGVLDKFPRVRTCDEDSRAFGEYTVYEAY